ncbi:MAG: ribonuclease E/G, partial [Nocardioidaceae bacterium]
NNLEAAEEIVRQLRLRDIGGIIVVDFIDMVLESNRDLVLRRLIECLGRDRTRHQVAEVTSLGLVQMTRKRIGTGLLEAFSEPCEHCGGRGLHTHHEPIEPKKSKHDSDDSRRGGRRTRRGEGGRSDKAGGRKATSDKGSGKPVEEAAKEPAKQADREVTEKPAKEPAPTVQPAKEAGDAVPGTAAPQPAAAVAPPAAEAASPPVASPPEQETPAAASERSPRRTRRRAATRAAGPPVPSGSTDAHPRPTEQPVGHFDPNSADSV